MTAFRVFSGWDRRQAEAAEVFAYSVTQNSSIPPEFYYSSADAAPMSFEDGALMNPARCARRGRTAFSYSRFMVPHACGYQGRALFADGCDQLCLGDVAELAEFDMGGKPLAVVKHQAPARLMQSGRARSWTSLMLMDCAALANRLTIDRVETWPDNDLMRLRFLADHEIADLPPEWNAMVEPGSEPPEGTKIAHWSAISDPDIGPWIDAGGSDVWREWRDRWRASTKAGGDDEDIGSIFAASQRDRLA